eukprot:TRINITY_DN13167_c0_g1_i3.p1 TRINITY_DN13167_c0_g1~~TRINITY_DN13167_c0_g1_i3.p1  ORF type:complete len:176 (+),score=31.81 TRINITY_DN13167_c0_g1_i3:150-677(+)
MACIKKEFDETMMSCSECMKSYAYKTILDFHLTEHNAEHPFTCEQCEKVLGFQDVLEMHIKSHCAQKYYSTLSSAYTKVESKTVTNKEGKTASNKVGNQKPAMPTAQKKKKRKNYKRRPRNIFARNPFQFIPPPRPLLPLGYPPFSCNACGMQFGYKHHLVTHSIHWHAADFTFN